MSTLFEALWDGDDDGVVRALRGGADPESREDDETALYRAAVGNQPVAVRLLLAAGADPGRRGGADEADLPLCGAACGGHTEVVRALLAAGADPDQEEGYGFTALAWAVRLGHTEVLRELLEAGAAPDRPGPDGLAPLVAAARRGSASCVRALLEHGAGSRAEALAEARRWVGADLAAALRRGLVEGGGAGDTYEAVVRRVPEDGGVTVVVELLGEDGAPTRGDERQSGHAAIATLLEGALGIRVPHEELAGRALACGDPAGDDWTTAVAALAARADETVFTAATGWCDAPDPLRRALGAQVLGALPGFAGRAVAVLCGVAAREAGRGAEWVAREAGGVADPAAREAGRGAEWVAREAGGVADPAAREAGGGSERAVPDPAAPETAHEPDPAAPEPHAREAADGPDPAAREAGADPEREARQTVGWPYPAPRKAADGPAPAAPDPAPEPARSLAAALGQGADPAAVPALLGLARHPDEEVRRLVAASLTGLVPSGHAEARAVLIGLSRDRAPRVRDWATLALAELPDDTPALREALAARLADPDPETAAEAARGLALRQDPRAVEALARLLADADPAGPARETALSALEHLTDARTRTRLEWTAPRCR
ncbi:ankyrin repeat domain-containing protein [Streptomyces sp. NPDC048659]|uniref:ankyrin repeat domain-containing protein n=1 Tax=Streptomyces sp. NPDC048659 TaxID=3155489 RepID=UPI003437C362